MSEKYCTFLSMQKDTSP